MTKEEKKTKEKKEIWVVGEVPTQTTPVVVNTATEEQLDIHLALARVLNDLEKLKKLLD